MESGGAEVGGPGTNGVGAIIGVGVGVGGQCDRRLRHEDAARRGATGRNYSDHQ